ncbi:MAG: ATP-binding protein, partial [Proteobacteria bacterium]|nr:ATP-binding protein [Pseudomonadota bacterium]
MKNKIVELLENLKFKGMLTALDHQIALAENGTATPQIIYNLLQEELRFRQERSMQSRLHNAKLPWEWTLNSFPFLKQPDI